MPQTSAVPPLVVITGGPPAARTLAAVAARDTVALAMGANAKTSRERVITRARELVTRLGATGFTMKRLADSLKVKPPAVYREFSSGEELLLAVRRQVFEELLAHIELTAKQTRDFTKAADRILEAWLQFARNNKGAYALLMSPTGNLKERDRELSKLNGFFLRFTQRARLPFTGSEFALAAYLHGSALMLTEVDNPLKAFRIAEAGYNEILGGLMHDWQ